MYDTYHVVPLARREAFSLTSRGVRLLKAFAQIRNARLNIGMCQTFGSKCSLRLEVESVRSCTVCATTHGFFCPCLVLNSFFDSEHSSVLVGKRPVVVVVVVMVHLYVGGCRRTGWGMHLPPVLIMHQRTALPAGYRLSSPQRRRLAARLASHTFTAS
jgi:hypothetical protein